VGKHGRDEEHGQEPAEWRRRTLPGQPVLGHDEQHGHQPEHLERGDAVDEHRVQATQRLSDRPQRQHAATVAMSTPRPSEGTS
jgi:hypothetical protein